MIKFIIIKLNLKLCL